MKTVLVTIKEVDLDEAYFAKKEAVRDARLPIEGHLTDPTGESLWLGNSFMNFLVKHILDNDIRDNHIYFIKDR